MDKELLLPVFKVRLLQNDNVIELFVPVSGLDNFLTPFLANGVEVTFICRTLLDMNNLKSI